MAAHLATRSTHAALNGTTSLPPLWQITPRRAQYLALIEAHYTNYQIAAHLGAAPATVKHTIEQLRSLMQSRSKRDLAR